MAVVMSIRTRRHSVPLLLLLIFAVLLSFCPQRLRADDLLEQLRAKQHAQATSVVTASATPQIEVFFSPGGGCTAAIVRELNAAKASVLVQAYSFTSAHIAKALVEANRRGVKVQVVLDYSNKSDKYSSADFVAHAGIATFLDGQHKIAHNKVMVIDEATVITGSFNFTKSAESDNGENLLVIRDRALAAKYAANWQAHRAHAEPYAGR